MRFALSRLLGTAGEVAGAPPIPGARWYIGRSVGDGLSYRFPSGALAGARWLTFDLLIGGTHLAVFQLSLQEGEGGRIFHLYYAALNQCSARFRMALEAVNQNRWRYEREGAWLKPMCGGSRVDLRLVDRATITLLRKSDAPVLWCQTEPVATADEPPLLTDLVLPAGPLLDELGQSTLHEWPEKSGSAEEVTARLRSQAEQASNQRWPESFSRWGGWLERRVEASGWFRTHHDGQRWWLVDPDGYLFWSAGPNCVRVDTDAAFRGLEQALTWLPEREGPYAGAFGKSGDGQPTFNYLAANLIRAFGEGWYERWAEIALASLRDLGFNTVANWSDWRTASRGGFPYVRPLQLTVRHTPLVYRDMPDVFHPGWEQDAEAFAEQLRETAADPALIGYFLMNEPTWGFASETPAAGMLYTTESCSSRTALASFLRARYGTDGALSRAWGMAGLTYAAVTEGRWTQPLTDGARADLAGFSGLMVERFFGQLAGACRRIDPHHLNLGIRYHTVPPQWALAGMSKFDVFSMNGYDRRIRGEDATRITEMLKMPVMIGEWHFGALDAGLPGSGIGHVPTQEDRGRAYRVYLEDAAAHPACVGAHWFTLYDESALGRFDGENWNIGFLDVCNHSYDALGAAARSSHARLYEVAAGRVRPYDDEPEYLPKLFM